MKDTRNYIFTFLIILCFGLVPALVSQLFTREPADRYIHIRSFRYGKEPSVIRCNRGDRLHLTFSTDDTGHSFFLEEFDIDAKVSPAREKVEVFKTSDPTLPSFSTRELTFTARHPGILNYLVAKSNYRCHVWCGPMHAFEQGKLVIFPNTLLIFSLGCIAGILYIWLTGIFKVTTPANAHHENKSGYRDVLKKVPFLRKIIISRWPQILLTLVAMMMIYVVILTALLGTKMSGRNLGVLMMWAIWLFVLVAILTPFLGRIWCTVCPLPFFGDLIQRGSFFTPAEGKTGKFNNRFSGFFLKWPHRLQNDWLKLFVFMLLATFSTTLVANPRVSGITVLMLMVVPTAMAVFWELRAFCRYVCPVSVFVGPFSRMSTLALRNKSQQVCDRCKTHYCEKGSPKGWACPYGLNVGEMKENSDCGLCLECTRSCLYNNVTLYRRPFGTELGTRSLSESWLTLAVFTLAMVYSVLYAGHWPVVRDFVNILDKKNWDLFGIYAIIVWMLALVLIPGLIYLFSGAGKRLSGIRHSNKDIFLMLSGTLLPMGLMLWIAFVIPMLFVNVTFIIQSVSDPFGWGWDFFGTANIPWHQFLPRLVPWIQSVLVLIGLWLSLRNLKNTGSQENLTSRQLFLLVLPTAAFIASTAVAMVFFYTN
ncbi:MAG TPA: 4Fe-4S binding protein [Bacteroidales bacterium]|nr:4Fe-4S binding protein [Bacteroidales bacterium]